MRHFRIILTLVLCFFLTIQKSYCQEKKRSIIQLSGVIVSSDSSKPIPFSTVVIKTSKRGVRSDFWGYFTLPIDKHDTIEVSAIGYKKATFVVPDTLKKSQYYSVIEMRPDTVFLKTVVIHPWPPIEQFKQIFLQKKVPDDMLERAKKNLDRADMKVLFDRMPMDGYMNYRNTFTQYADKLYYAGQYPPLRILDPLAWAKFIKALKNGELKRSKD